MVEFNTKENICEVIKTDIQLALINANISKMPRKIIMDYVDLLGDSVKIGCHIGYMDFIKEEAKKVEASNPGIALALVNIVNKILGEGP